MNTKEDCVPSFILNSWNNAGAKDLKGCSPWEKKKRKKNAMKKEKKGKWERKRRGYVKKGKVMGKE